MNSRTPAATPITIDGGLALTGLSKQLTAIATRLEDVNWEANAERLADDARELADLGWTVSSDMVPAETGQVVEEQGPEGVDDWFLDFHHTPDGRTLSRLRPALLDEDSVLGRWRPLLEQALEAYERGHPAVIIPTLLSITEGTIARLTGQLNSPDTNVRGMAEELVDQHEKPAIAWVIANSAQQYINNIFQSQPFSEQRPEIINRHWILHGRDRPDWGDADALRLFQGLETLSLAAGTGDG